MEAMKRNAEHRVSSSVPAPVIRSEDFPSLTTQRINGDVAGGKQDSVMPIAPVLPLGTSSSSNWAAAMQLQPQPQQVYFLLQ